MRFNRAALYHAGFLESAEPLYRRQKILNAAVFRSAIEAVHTMAALEEEQVLPLALIRKVTKAAVLAGAIMAHLGG